jgi:hypothetical protein
MNKVIDVNLDLIASLLHEDTSWLADEFGLLHVSSFNQKVIYDHNTLQYRVLTSIESIIEDCT